MSRRVVLRLTEYSETIQAFEDFLATARAAGAGPRSRVREAQDEDGNRCFYIELPEAASAALERKERPAVRTKTQQAVRDQTERRKAAIAAGDTVPGHVPPVVKKRKLKIKK